MFRILLSSGFSNASTLANPKIGLIKADFVSSDQTGVAKGSKVVYDPCKTINFFETKKDELRGPVILDTQHIDHQSHDGRTALGQMMGALHAATGHTLQAGFARLWPAMAHSKPSQSQAEDLVMMPYKQNRYGEPDVARSTQFIICWAHPFTTSWSEWEDYIAAVAAVTKPLGKPIYADITLKFHPLLKPLQNKPVDPDKLSTMIHKAYHNKYDGVFLRNGHGTFDAPYHQAASNVLNQINE